MVGHDPRHDPVRGPEPSTALSISRSAFSEKRVCAHARLAEVTSGSRCSQRWVAGAHFDHVFRPTAEARLRNLSGQQVISRPRLVLSIAC